MNSRCFIVGRAITPTTLLPSSHGIATSFTPTNKPYTLTATTPAPSPNRYWDWTLDHTNLIRSPIWDPIHGFGSNGSGPKSVAGGHCVQDGPFANLTTTYFEGKYHPHCLSRGFLDEETIKRVGNLTVQPVVLREIITQTANYFDFLLAVEQMSHLTIPYIVQGDFSKVTAPNDPVFFLHHAQVDRVWWSWQLLSPERRGQ
ncbi:hypothetical protein ASPCADRAFT_205583 [Aspergillus carbonarius ITEM 5010]|uniref:Tyrosinase copper-binding domain-containing protein n=1 Tax=Aspergillus carbonarius (strain ITEM 5010) TaxID=602072 RepID=A0A1R3RV43_ASPC5|nr:hypothetical protein ASPCADRAFT_205583 [Aspergillus carbonarius ITEM 5010]